MKPTLGCLKLMSLSHAHLRLLYRTKLDAGLSARTVGYIHVTLYGALQSAVLDGLIPRNVAEAVKPPRAERREICPATSSRY